MVEVVFLKKENVFCGYEIKGHSGFAQSGCDIVCASVSSVAIMVANTITEIMRCSANAQSEDGFLRLEIMNDAHINDARQILDGLHLFLKDLAADFPENVKVKYGGVQNA